MTAFEGRLLAAARVLTGLTIVELAKEAGVTPRTIHRLELSETVQVSEGRQHGHVTRTTWDRVVDVFRRQGVELIGETSKHGGGVRLLKRRADADRTSEKAV